MKRLQTVLLVVVLSAAAALAAPAYAQSPAASPSAPQAAPAAASPATAADAGKGLPRVGGNCNVKSKTQQCCLGKTCRGRVLGGQSGMACQQKGGESWHGANGVCHPL
ncbi:hypothetical protein [Lysobacter enzymogenes]|uniref:hypothetical protein n=1 Tax=Lysobacter enzymogenes TaxID=69 RepID=UPI001AF8831B|nr:hypothetical protein [Lysobacter enzymogenes]QQQ00638.1 hypothetical protein JHW41_21575 [Lysobacter enzymogenes]